MNASPLSLLERLTAARVDFVVIGGFAVIAHGYIRTTEDLDITYSTEPANLYALADVLMGVDARLRGVAEVLPFVPDARTLHNAELLTLDTNHGALDLLAAPPGAPPFPELKRRAEVVDLDAQRVLVASLDDLLAMKRAAGRPRDLIDIEALEAIQQLRADQDT